MISKIKYEYSLNTSIKHKAFDYQKETVDALKDMEYAAIFHEQGLGKTKIAIDILLYWLSEKSIDCVIIVTKKTLVSNWIKEFEEHTNIKPRILSSKKGDNFFILNSTVRVIITNFETISIEKYRIELFLKTRVVGVIIDESTKIKNPESKLTKDFFYLSQLFCKRIIMTGTPIANRPYDIWSQIYFLDAGKSLGLDFSLFKKKCNLTNDLNVNEERRLNFENNVSSIFDKIKSFSVRETKNSGIISLPSKKYFDIMIPFEEKQFAMYETLRQEMKLEVLRGNYSIIDESQNAIKRLLRLVQITSCPALIDNSYEQISAKEEKLRELINNIINRNEKAIIWSIFTENIDRFSKLFKSYGASKLTGKMSIEERIKSVNNFKNGESKLLFATPQSAKEGLTLTEANNAIFYDRGFNLDDYLQAQDRIHRISQKKDCNIYNLMISDSIDIWINQLLVAKQRAALLAQGDMKLKTYQAEADYSFSEIVSQILNIQK